MEANHRTHGFGRDCSESLRAKEVGEIECFISVERQIGEPARLLRDYRFRFDQKRRELIRSSVVELVDAIDANLRTMTDLASNKDQWSKKIEHGEFDQLKQHVAEINTLLGSSVGRPGRWMDLQRHLHFGMIGDLHDIIENDWPSVKAGLRKSLYGEKEPVPMGIEDLGELVSQKPRRPVATKLLWSVLTDEEFERLIFVLLSLEHHYENPEWLMKTSAPDRGRDLSVHRIHDDPLGGKFRQRLIIQCKHWQTKSVNLPDIASLREQVKLWQPPRIDVCVIATSGRFTSDAVAWVEAHNMSDSALSIEMWPESHLERLLASRPAVIAEFGLR
ncbi:restriction endonuclease [Luteibacter rhizovicinus]|uniref:Restriction endonuclease n=1 Tax=Luteibacter rhizovicinus TaxID=242606 RepID=A0A4R3YID5_9GAMM|nr:restriction endonuclease [Luteibacter rhizovicinus]TCV92117.1 restriction endonuclease [Luteibacter rhizovicinus]